MHGVVFTSLRDYLTSIGGPTLVEQAFREESVFLLSESYPDELLTEVVDRAAAASGRQVGDLVEEFGVFAAQTTFARLYPAFFAIAPTARDFLLTVETRIHELVRATIPNAAPPQLRVSDAGEDGVRIVYSSPRRLCVFLRGLVQGTAAHYGESASLRESTCMLEGDDACTFDVTLSAQTA